MNSIFNLCKAAWKVFNFIRKLIVNFVFVVFVLLMVSLVALLSPPKSAELVGDQGALWIALDGYLADNREQSMTWQKALNELENGYAPRQISTFDLVYAIENAIDDDRIKGIVLDLNYFEGADLPALEYVGKALNAFKQQNKPVIAFADNYSQQQYFLASFADEIYLNPMGNVAIEGLFAQNLYFKSMLDKLEVNPHVFRVGSYKSAVEPFLRDNMSPESKANTQRWLHKMWENYRSLVAQNRGIDKNQVLPASAQYLADLKALKGDSTAYVKQRKLVTKFATRAELEQNLTALFGKIQQAQPKEQQVKHIGFDDYLAALPDRQQPEYNQSSPKIAVVNVEGTIIDGENYENEVGGDSIARLLHQAAKDDEVKAVILRVNSPGGSAFASEIIRQEIDNLRAAGKPVVTSMGGMAASGGYWIASNTDYIVADKNSITGSIGIFALFPTVENSLKKLGIHADGVSTSPFSEMSSVAPLNPELSQMLQLEIEQGYARFIELVSKGRGLSKEEVEKVAQGQIWLGQEALEHKLVDELGDFATAVQKAEELANQSQQSEQDYAIEWLVEEEQGWAALMQSLQQEIKVWLKNSVAQSLGLASLPAQQMQQSLHLFNQMNDPKGQYLYCLNCMKVR